MQPPDRIGAKALLPVTLVGDVDAEGRCIVQLDCGTYRIEVPYKAITERTAPMPMKVSGEADIREAAMAICAERCAFMGEPPCWQVKDDQGNHLPWPAPACDDPGCMALAARAVGALTIGE